jgi:hypothetical protein
MLNSGYFITILHKNSGKLSTAPPLPPGKNQHFAPMTLLDSKEFFTVSGQAQISLIYTQHRKKTNHKSQVRALSSLKWLESNIENSGYEVVFCDMSVWLSANRILIAHIYALI